MADLNNSFIAGIMNKDLDERLLPEGVYRDALNVIVDSSTNSAVGTIQNQNGNVRIANVATVAGFPSITNAKTIGAVCVEKDNLIYWLVSCDQFDGIYEYNEITGNTLRVLQSNKPTPTTPSKLNFNQGFIVTGINYVNGFLFWTDNYNPPRRINISRVRTDSLGTGGYNIDDPRIDDDINVILAAPLNGPSIKLYKDGSQSNNLEEKFVYFAYRYKYVDNQFSSLSPFSAVAFFPKNYQVDFAVGYNKAMLNSFNTADVTIYTGSQFVKEIQVIMYDSRAINCHIIETLNKQELNLQDEVYKTFTFNNNKTYATLPPDQLTRLFDNVPLLAKAQDFVGNRIMYGNYTQFYDIDYPVKLKVDYVSIDNSGNKPLSTFRSDRDYEIGIIYLDKYGRHTTALTSLNNTVYIPPSQSDKGNSLKVSIQNKPPKFASHFRIVIKQNKGSYYNLFPIAFYADNKYRYFLINQSDRDKISVGSYVIFKAAPDGVTHSNRKLKILEIENKANGWMGSAPSGLYFKVKVSIGDPFWDPTAGVSGAYFGGYGSNGLHNPILSGGVTGEILIPSPIRGRKPYVEKPIYYGDNNPDVLFTYPDAGDWVTKDWRITLKVESPTMARWTTNINGSVEYDLAIQSGITNILWGPTGGTQTLLCSITWTGTPTVGDIWKINVRGGQVTPSLLPPYYNPLTFTAQYVSEYIPNYFDGKGIPNPNILNTVTGAFEWFREDNGSQQTGGYAVMGCDWYVQPGDVITIKYNEDSLNLNKYLTIQQWPSDSYYENLEEWFIESGAYQSFIAIDQGGSDIGELAVSFNRGANYQEYVYDNFPSAVSDSATMGRISHIGYSKAAIREQPLYMFLQGFGKDNDVGSLNLQIAQKNVLTAAISLTHYSNLMIAETPPQEGDLDIYHELSDTYEIRDGYHKVTWDYADFSSATFPVQYAGKTNLGQNFALGPFPTANDKTHSYIAGEKVWVKSSNTSIITPGLYEILYVPNKYNIIIDLNFPGAAPATPGTTGYDEIEKHQTGYNNYGQSAIIKINNPLATVNSNFNAWTFKNGLESYRVRDDFNAAELKYSPRATTEIKEYGQKISKNAICYSGIYGANTGINELNEFNLSMANFKYLDGEFGSIQKLYARDTDLLVFQENKVSTVLYGKNLLSDAVGGGQVASVPEVLGTQIAYPYEYGISKNPESFTFWGEAIFFTDSRRGVVLQMIGNQIVEISSNGMKDYFMELMRDYPNTQKLGAYDPHNHQYVLSSNDISILGCKLTLSRNENSIAGTTSSFTSLLFTIISDINWSISVVSMGFGTNWVTNYQTFGFGTQDITAIIATNNTGQVRKIKFVVTYCDGLTQEFILTQGIGEPNAGNGVFVIDDGTGWPNQLSYDEHTQIIPFP